MIEHGKGNSRLRSARTFTGALLVFVLVSVAAAAQRFPSDFWHEGKIALLQGDTIRGMVKYDLMQNIVQFSRSDQTLEAFTARKVLFFEIFDKTGKLNRYRQFYVLPYAVSAGTYETPVFFELLEDGKMTLLAREAIELRTVNYGFYGPSYTQQVLVNKYFFLNDKGQIVEFTGNKQELLNMMGRNADSVDKYMRKNRLRLDDKNDFARIIAYYNSLHRS